MGRRLLHMLRGGARSYVDGVVFEGEKNPPFQTFFSWTEFSVHAIWGLLRTPASLYNPNLFSFGNRLCFSEFFWAKDDRKSAEKAGR